MESEIFAVEATMPPSTTVEQLREMLQSLLAERFKLRVHRESGEMSAYSLTVAKNGPKLGRAGPIPMSATGPNGAPITLSDQLLRPQRGSAGAMSWTGLRATMTELAEALADETQRPVTNATELKGKFDFRLTFRHSTAAPSPETEDLPDVFTALRSVGLRLDSVRKPAEVIVVDHLEKDPAEP